MVRNDIKKVVIVSHIYATGPSQELEKYLINQKIERLLFIGHPFLYSGDICSFWRLYVKGNRIKSCKAYPWRLPEILMYCKDVLYTFLWVILDKQRYDIYIGADNLNAFTGLLLKKLGMVEKVFFYTIDYIPLRFKNRFLNGVYHWIDSFCIKYCDKVWNLSERMMIEREKKEVSSKYREKQITVPVGTNLNIKICPFEDIDRYTLAFMGHLREGQGLDFLIDLFPEIVSKFYEAKLLIIGTGPLEDSLKKKVSKLGLSGHVKFSGYIEKHEEVEKMLSKCAVGIALYEDNDITYTRYADPGKPKAYMAAGLPVVITNVPAIANEIDKNKAGIAVRYKKKDAVRAIINILSDDLRLIEYRKNALKFARNFEWTLIFESAFDKSGVFI